MSIWPAIILEFPYWTTTVFDSTYYPVLFQDPFHTEKELAHLSDMFYFHREYVVTEGFFSSPRNDVSTVASSPQIRHSMLKLQNHYVLTVTTKIILKLMIEVSILYAQFCIVYDLTIKLSSTTPLRIDIVVRDYNRDQTSIQYYFHRCQCCLFFNSVYFTFRWSMLSCLVLFLAL